MEGHICKKCGEPLPEGYGHQHCEACRRQLSQRIQAGFWAALAAAPTVAMTIAALVLGGSNRKKSGGS